MMYVSKYRDTEINFISDACAELKYEAPEIIEVPTANGMRLIIGCYRNRWYNVILADGRKRLTALQLRIRPQQNGRPVFEPHSYTRKPYRGNQYAEQLYRWILDNGFILKSSGEQTAASHRLWAKLALTYKLRAFDNSTNKYTSLSRIDRDDVVLELSLK